MLQLLFEKDVSHRVRLWAAMRRWLRQRFRRNRPDHSLEAEPEGQRESETKGLGVQAGWTVIPVSRRKWGTEAELGSPSELEVTGHMHEWGPRRRGDGPGPI